MITRNDYQLDLFNGDTGLIVRDEERDGALRAQFIDPEGRKRSIYTFQRRSLNNPFLGVFDAPVFNTSCARRRISITPLQALSMFDGQFVNEEASHFAQRVRQEANIEPNEQIHRAFQLAFSRSPRPAELQQSQAFFTSAASHEEALVGLCRVLLNTNELLYID